MKSDNESGTELLIFATTSSTENCDQNANRQPNSGGKFRRIAPGTDLVEEGRKMAKRLDAFIK